MRYQYTLIWRCSLQAFLNDFGVCCLTPGKIDARHVESICFGDSCEAVAEGPNGDRDYVVARRKEVDHSGLLPTCAGGCTCQDRRCRLEEVFQACVNTTHNSGE